MYVVHSADGKRVSSKTLRIKSVTVLAFSVFARHGHLHNAEALYEELLCLSYLAYFTPSYVPFHDAISCGYAASFFI